MTNYGLMPIDVQFTISTDPNVLALLPEYRHLQIPLLPRLALALRPIQNIVNYIDSSTVINNSVKLIDDTLGQEVSNNSLNVSLGKNSSEIVVAVSAPLTPSHAYHLENLSIMNTNQN